MPRVMLRASPSPSWEGSSPGSVHLGQTPLSCSWVAQPQCPQALAQPATTNDDVSEMALVPWGPWQAHMGQDVEGRFAVALSVWCISCGAASLPHNHL